MNAKYDGRFILIAGIWVVLTLIFAPVFAHDEHEDQNRAQTTIHYRQAVYRVIGWNMSALAGMVKGTIPFDAAVFARDAARISQMAPMLPEGFTPESAQGAKTDAKPEIWTHFDDFTSRIHSLEQKSAALAEIAKTGDPARIKPAFFELAKVCKACHEKYHAK